MTCINDTQTLSRKGNPSETKMLWISQKIKPSNTYIMIGIEGFIAVIQRDIQGSSQIRYSP